jgi:hypothetical protein
MPEPSVPLVETLACVKCGRAWIGPVKRWRLYPINEDPPRPVAYCPACAEQESDQAEPPV